MGLSGFFKAEPSIVIVAVPRPEIFAQQLFKN